jgi:hypothetical protein
MKQHISPERFHRFFRAKGQSNVVLEQRYLRFLPAKQQQALLEIVLKIRNAFDPDIARQAMEKVGPLNMLQRMCSDGYLVLSVDGVCRMSIDEMAALQHIVELYKDERMCRGATAVEEKCKCNGKPGCRLCRGSGKFLVYDEMTDRERTLADGRA